MARIRPNSRIKYAHSGFSLVKHNSRSDRPLRSIGYFAGNYFAMIKWKTFAIGCSLALALLLIGQRKPSMSDPNVYRAVIDLSLIHI